MALDPITSAIDFVSNIGGKIIDKLWPDPTEAAKAKLALMQLQQAGEFKEVELRYQAIVAEAQSQDKWTSRARPSFLYVVYTYILAAIPVAIVAVFRPESVIVFTKAMNAFLAAIPDQLWYLFGIGYLGYTASRSYDKAKANGGK